MTVTETPATTDPRGNEEKSLSLPYRGRPLLSLMQSFPEYLFSPEEDNPLERAVGPGGSQRQPIILVVEDESVQAIFLQRMLRRFGYETPEHAVSGPEAIEKAARFSPDLILMDVRLRGPMDGITAADHIQRNMDVPVIYLTAYADQATVRRAHETKCYGFLEKPVDDQVLWTTIEAALNRRRAELEGNEPDDTD